MNILCANPSGREHINRKTCINSNSYKSVVRSRKVERAQLIQRIRRKVSTIWAR